jgi:hypothetical protein
MSAGSEPADAMGVRPPGDIRVRLRTVWQRYAFAIVPAIGIFELLAHVKQANSAPTDDQWRAARAAVEPKVTSSDLVIFAPEWTEPLGRRHFGSELASIERMARPDETRFPRAIEVSIRGAHRPELAGWKTVERERIGPFEVTTRENPNPVTIVDDLVAHVRPDRMSVSVVSGNRDAPCPWTRGPVLSGGLGFGPSLPAERFVCPGGGLVAVTVISDPTYQPRRCIYAPPVAGAVVRLRFHAVSFGRTFHGHHAIPAEADHTNGAPVTIAFRSDSGELGQFTRRDGTGWTPYETETLDLEGKTTDLVADITAASSDRRQYCFEADTR